MNPQLHIAMAHSRQQDLHREASRGASGLSTGSGLTARLRESIQAMWPTRAATQSPTTAIPAA